MPDNSTINYIKETISAEANNWGSTLTDWMNTKYGIPLNSQITYNEQLSKLITNLFTNTKVNVYLFTSKKVAVICIPGATRNVTPEMLRMQQALDESDGNPNTIESSTFESFSNCLHNALKDKGESKLEYNPKTKKLSINIPEVTVYISTNYINCLNYDDEIIASILQQIAVNTRLFKDIVIRLSLVIGTSTALASIIACAAIPISSFGMDKLIKSLVAMGITLFASYAINVYVGRCRNIEFDEFVVKCGYGDALNRAINNYNKYLFGNSDTKSGALENLNTLDKLCHWFNKMIAYVENMLNWMGITTHQSIGQREDTIKEKTEIVDNKNPDQYIDRSKHLQELLDIIINDTLLLNEVGVSSV